MKPSYRVWLVCLICGFAWLAPAQAQYPTRSIRFILPFPPGGGTDTMGRAIGTRLGEALGNRSSSITAVGAAPTSARSSRRNRRRTVIRYS